MQRQVKHLMALMAVAVLAAGCATPFAPMEGDPAFAPRYPIVEAPSASTSGSLYSETSFNALFNDKVANRVGDIITVRLNENTVSRKSASTSVSKSNKNSVTEPTILGKRLSVPPANNLKLTDLSNESDFSGQADSDQSNSLKGNIAVTIAEVLPNGSFVVRGEKWMQLNQGDEYIRISGMIRPVDIDSSNGVDSTRIANARITYGGKGTMADSNRMGWLARFFVSPIFAY